MQELITKAKGLLESKKVSVVIGYGKASRGIARPLIVRNPEQATLLVWDDGISYNLATYLTKPEVRKLGRAAIVALPSVLRSILQLASERQLADDSFLALTVTKDGTVRELPTLMEIETYLATVPDQKKAADRKELDLLLAMTAEQRRAYWDEQLGRCIKCYACRSSCPMCYCERCTMDVNRPQWVPVASHALGNLEYHLVRAMHLAGRCVQCGTCGEACPVGIPVHLLTFFAEDSVRKQFGQSGGTTSKSHYALSTFRPDDKESFIR